jgi:gamma-glutamylcyclotransferase (GGCT)/AIG2-like uncharacterized protein YtfP
MLFFTYGTLKQGECRNHVLGNCEFLGKAKTKEKFRLYHVSGGNYPALLQEDDGIQIEGEVYDISKELIKTLDGIEGTNMSPPLYIREVIEVVNENNETLNAIVYIFANEYPMNMKKCTNSNWTAKTQGTA